MSDDESFIVLGSTPTPSLEQYVSGNVQRQESLPGKTMATSAAQTISNNFSLIRGDESLKSLSPKSVQSVQGSPSGVASMNGSNPLAASVIMGETKSSLFQTFPSLMNSSMPLDEIQMLQHLMNEHGQMKENLQMANVAMRKNFTSIQKWQEEVKAKYAHQVRLNDEQNAIITQLKEDNDKLKQLVLAGETRVAEQDKRAAELKISLEKALDEVQNQSQAERAAAQAELDELKKALSEKESIVRKYGPGNSNEVQFITKEEHDRQIKVLQREMSVIVAKNLEFEDMPLRRKFLAKIAPNWIARPEKSKPKTSRWRENIRELKTLAEQVDVLTAQLDIYKNDFEAERTARAELASEKDRVLTDLKLLQRRNQQLIEEVQNGRVAEERTTRAANESLDRREPTPPRASSSAEGATGGGGGAAREEQTYDRPVLYCPLCNQGYRDLVTLPTPRRRLRRHQLNSGGLRLRSGGDLLGLCHTIHRYRWIFATSGQELRGTVTEV
ncbi:LOW QUALITY PROTEIN: NF-kappa-B essential modulator-like [Aedes aegypti]|uniref:NF-kappa-B essential modulator NEMO CC2-LZ domain-containing protein n=1 Tax=Aedes aegypti TaxID=7159 RepID=A0A903VHK7_AEDAE|nr:LOW QUALITY PROTEIN: NF-kappa-B essential modulator-like [Aedes aegypti]